MFYVVTVLTDQLEVFEIQRYRRIVDVRSRQPDLVVYDLADLVLSLLSAALAESAVQISPRFVCVPAGVPLVAVIKRFCVIFCHFKKESDRRKPRNAGRNARG